MIDLDENRLHEAKRFSATDVINSDKEDVAKRIMSETKDGVDVAIEAVGVPVTFDVCQQIIRPGGHIANVGIHGKSVDFQLQDLWIKNMTLTTGQVNINTTPHDFNNSRFGKNRSKKADNTSF